MSTPKRTEMEIDAFVDWVVTQNVADTIQAFIVLMYANGHFDKADLMAMLEQGGKSAE